MLEGPDRPAPRPAQRRVAEVAARAKDDLRGARAWVGIAIVESDKARAAEVAPTRLGAEGGAATRRRSPRAARDRAAGSSLCAGGDEQDQRGRELIAAIAAYGRDQKPGPGGDGQGNEPPRLHRREPWQHRRGAGRVRAHPRHLGKSPRGRSSQRGDRAEQHRRLLHGHGEERRGHRRAAGKSQDDPGALASPDSPVLARTLESMAAVLIADRKYDEALALLRKALAINENLVGQAEPSDRWAPSRAEDRRRARADGGHRRGDPLLRAGGERPAPKPSARRAPPTSRRQRAPGGRRCARSSDSPRRGPISSGRSSFAQKVPRPRQPHPAPHPAPSRRARRARRTVSPTRWRWIRSRSASPRSRGGTTIPRRPRCITPSPRT